MEKMEILVYAIEWMYLVQILTEDLYIPSPAREKNKSTTQKQHKKQRL